MNTYLLTVIGRDRAGIISSVTGVLFNNGSNLEDICMTVLEGELAMMLILSVSPSKEKAIRKAFQKLEKRLGLTFFWKRLPQANLIRGEAHPRNTETYLISAAGPDRTGIVYQISAIFARRGFNITDLNSRILGRGAKAIYVMLLEVDIPKKYPIRTLEKIFARAQSQLGIEIQLKPLERLSI